MSQVLVRNLDSRVLERLKARAWRNGRSLQAELREILEAASQVDLDATLVADRIRQSLRARRTTDSGESQAKDRGR